MRSIKVRRFMCTIWPSAAAEWAKPYRSAAALRSKGSRACEIMCSAYLRIWFSKLHLRIWNMLRVGGPDPEFHLCVFLEHICKVCLNALHSPTFLQILPQLY